MRAVDSQNAEDAEDDTVDIETVPPIPAFCSRWALTLFSVCPQEWPDLVRYVATNTEGLITIVFLSFRSSKFTSQSCVKKKLKVLTPDCCLCQPMTKSAAETC